MTADYRSLEQMIGYRFNDASLLDLALTHPSFCHENDQVSEDNQRLEYLGDAVLCLIVAEYLFKTHPHASAGEMTEARAQLIQDSRLARIGESIGIGAYLHLGRGEEKNGGAKRPSNLADAVEALLCAAWIDGGACAVDRIFRTLFLPEPVKLNTPLFIYNPKGELQEYIQHHGYALPKYNTIETTGPEHARLFAVEVCACGKNWTARAGSKRKAEFQAAVLALEELTGKKVSADRPVSDVSDPASE